MSRFMLIIIAGAGVLLASYVERRSAHLSGGDKDIARQLRGPDDAITTGSVRKPNADPTRR